MNHMVMAFLGHDLARYMDRSFLAGRRAHRPNWDFLPHHPLSPEVDRHVDWLTGSNHHALAVGAEVGQRIVVEIKALVAAIKADGNEADPRLERVGELGGVLTALRYLTDLEDDDGPA